MRRLLPAICLTALLGAPGGLAQRPDQPSVEKGAFPATWITGGPNCLEVPDWQIHEYNPNLYILRESGCSNYEKPFLYLIFGKDKALLLDTGAGKTDVDVVVKGVANMLDPYRDRVQLL